MSFNKKFVDYQLIEQCLNDDLTLDVLFKGDSFIFVDEISSKVYEWHSQQLPNNEIKIKLEEYGKRNG
jgi:hypothetical protein